MILTVIILVLLILNLGLMSMFAALGKKNLLLITATIEVILAVLFIVTSS